MKAPKQINSKLIITGAISATVIIIMIFLIIWAGRKFFGKSAEDKRNDENRKDFQQALNRRNVTLTETQLSAMAASIREAVDGAGTDEEAIFAAFSKLSTLDDFNALVLKYGYSDGDLISDLYDDLSNDEIRKLNGILSSRGISYQF